MENSNENQQPDTFYRYRSVTKCLSAGISFLTDNFLHIVKVSLPLSLAYAILMSAIVYILSNSSFIQTLAGADSNSSISKVTLGIILIVLMLLSFITLVLNYGLIFRMVHIHTHGISLKRYKIKPTLKSSLPYALKVFWFMLAITILAFICGIMSTIPFLFGGEGTIIEVIKLGAFAIICTLIFVFALPLDIALPSMFLEKGKSFKNVMYGYKKGFKVWGKVFCLSLLIGILVLLLVFVVSMPSLTMISAYNAATLSQLNGDSVHLPGGYSIWYIIILFITYYLYSFIFWIDTVPFCYLYASIKTDELEEAKHQFAINY